MAAIAIQAQWRAFKAKQRFQFLKVSCCWSEDVDVSWDLIKD